MNDFESHYGWILGEIDIRAKGDIKKKLYREYFELKYCYYRNNKNFSDKLISLTNDLANIKELIKENRNKKINNI